MERKIKRITSALVLLCMIFALATAAFAAYPQPTERVADEAGVLSESTVRQIKSANKTLMSKPGVMIAVCTIKTTGDTPIAEYARAVFKEWKLGEGVLIVIASDDGNYYFVQSTGIEKSITNADLEAIRDEYFEADFAAGNIDTGVMKTVSKLTGLLETKVTAIDSTGKNTDDAKTPEKDDGEKKSSALVTALKVVLYIVPALVAVFVVLFVAALFNDTAAAILRKYVFRKKKPYSMPPEYYDERLYGNTRKSAPPQQRQNGAPQVTRTRYSEDMRQRNGYRSGSSQPQRGQNPNNNGNGRNYPTSQGGNTRQR